MKSKGARGGLLYIAVTVASSGSPNTHAQKHILILGITKLMHASRVHEYIKELFKEVGQSKSFLVI